MKGPALPINVGVSAFLAQASRLYTEARASDICRNTAIRPTSSKPQG
jgi:hypothetical protein